jgi:uncharacterized membrane protein YqiK
MNDSHAWAASPWMVRIVVAVVIVVVFLAWAAVFVP